MGALIVTDADFEGQVLKADKTVLVDFWAPWCGPCKMIAPILDELAAEHEKELKVVKMNVDDNPEVPSKYGVRSLPTLMVFKEGQATSTKVGVVSKQALQQWIQEG